MKLKTMISQLSMACIGLVLMLDSGLARASSDTGTLLIGETSGICGAPIYRYSIDGFTSLIGSYSPTGLAGGQLVAAVYDFTPITCSMTGASLTVSGFSASPGSSWLISVTCNGVTNTGSSAAFGYSGGVAQWKWGQTFGLRGKNGSNVGCTIVHN